MDHPETIGHGWQHDRVGQGPLAVLGDHRARSLRLEILATGARPPSSGVARLVPTIFPHPQRLSGSLVFPRAILASPELTWGQIAKRALDLVAAVIGLVALGPFLALVALVILITSGRPVLYAQERVGQGGRTFRMFKFRSMRRDAETETGPVWATERDARCTAVGAWLRRTNVDELPQLINVLRGEMSLVGPRPERPVFVNRFRASLPGYDVRHDVAAGMTGWAQVHGWRGRTSLRKRLQYDLDYIRRWSFGLDLRILVMTIQHIAWGKTSWPSPRRGQDECEVMS